LKLETGSGFWLLDKGLWAPVAPRWFRIAGYYNLKKKFIPLEDLWIF